MVRRNRRRAQRRRRSAVSGLFNAKPKEVRTLTFTGIVAKNSEVALTLNNYNFTGPNRVLAGAFRLATDTPTTVQCAIRGEGKTKVIPSRIVLAAQTQSRVLVRTPRGEGYTSYNSTEKPILGWITNNGGNEVWFTATISFVSLQELQPNPAATPVFDAFTKTTEVQTSECCTSDD